MKTLTYECETLARSIVLFKLGNARDTAQDVDDVCGDVMLKLLAVLEHGEIRDVPAYVARVSYNVCHEYFRRRIPEWRRWADLGDAAGYLEAAPLDSSALDCRRMLERTWREVLELPLGQRLALLLNLRAPHGGDALHLLAETDIASKAEIADALEMPAGELEGIWEMLPLDDAAIGARLGIQRQQVINLRKSARKRLERRTNLVQ
jgi:hypothetical protein